MGASHPDRRFAPDHRGGLRLRGSEDRQLLVRLEDITSLTWLEAVSLVAAALFNLYTYWPQMTAAMPGLTIPQAAAHRPGR